MLRGFAPPGPSLKLVAAFVLLLLLPALVVVGLGLWLVVQDRQLEADDLRRRQESAADRVVRELTDRLASAEAALDHRVDPGDDAVVIVLGKSGIVTNPARRLLYHPVVPRDDAGASAAFATGESLEFRDNDPGAAEAAYRPLISHVSDDVKAGALVRLARVLRKQQRDAEALTLYDDLSRLSGASVDGVPAELVALRARGVVFRQQGNTIALQEHARRLRGGLMAGEWLLDAGTFEQYETESAGWGANEAPKDTDLALAEAVEYLWGRSETRGRHALSVVGTDTLLIWKSRGNDTIALFAGSAYQRRHWLANPGVLGQAGDFTVTFGLPATQAQPARDEEGVIARRARDSGLPWDVAVPRGNGVDGTRRRAWLLGGLGVLCLMVLAGGYVTARAISRELAVARLQADFVASVSHEFRTPLTSLRQFTELLNDPGGLPDEKRRGFYAAQARATDRLQRLVESLLDFRRMEAGAQAYERRRLLLAPLVEDVVTEFRREVEPRGFTVDVDVVADRSAIDADAGALSLALWNLLDNAVKYSGESRRVRVSVSCEDATVALAVQDRGMGIPLEEQREVFRKFVRGREARQRSIKGTGLGLAMVKHIVESHGGRVEVESAPGVGSTFRVVFPAVA